MRKVIAACVAAAILLLSGCSALFQKEYLSVAEYTGEEHNTSKSSAKEVSSYEELKLALESMVKNHVTEERLQFSGYEGTILDDLSQAKHEVEKETALGSFAVAYISHDLTPVVTQYRATIYISYKRTEAEIAAITNIIGQSRLKSFLDEALSGLNSYTAIRMNAPDLTEADITDTVNAVFDANPVSCVLRPELTVTLHPASAGAEHIIEIEFNYGRTTTVITTMRSALEQSISEIASDLQSSDKSVYAVEAYNALATRVSYDPNGEIRKADATLVPSLGATVYGAIVEGIADSAGIALAFSALCREAGIECLVVTGTLDKVEHSWNIIKLGGNYYHVDISADSTLGQVNAFGRSDAQFLGSNYWWNIESYPECGESINATDILAPAS